MDKMSRFDGSASAGGRRKPMQTRSGADLPRFAPNASMALRGFRGRGRVLTFRPAQPRLAACVTSLVLRYASTASLPPSDP
jgi:hypothetical protein